MTQASQRTLLSITRLDEPPAAAVLALFGDLDIVSGPQLVAAVGDVLAGGVSGRIVVDLADVPFLDSCGINALLACRAAAARAGAGLAVRRPRPSVRQVLAITGLLELFAVPAAA
ncbi:hypothetical protein GCM10010123_25660 [Pilimelia anulata]|uniref:Anti-sigma factor antagonist n=1 Tax=Pilimelia anulata TaxID=53371 RepID=A0A8J3B4B1_9ACTN|nr:STAS domain-containing protein [Pilimelia anulata]GGJ94732.1 hypothetical protein GCM10010123_25660 [Pilimelia anulata]